MFPELNNALHLQGTNNVTDDGIFILTTDSVLTNGSFLLVHFVSMYLKRGSDVCMISLDQSLQHYSAVLRKLVCCFCFLDFTRFLLDLFF